MILEKKAAEIRKTILEMIYRANFGHVGGAFSVTDILVALYYKHLNISPENIASPDRDRFILSKGHAVEALYAILADRNFIPREDLLTYSQFGSPYMCHPTNKITGIEMNTGSLGHGLRRARRRRIGGRFRLGGGYGGQSLQAGQSYRHCRQK